MSKRLLTMLASVAMLAMLATGCGGGEDEPPALTKAQFEKQANAICKELNEDTAGKYQAYTQKHKTEPSKAVSIKMTKQVYLANLESRLDALRALEPPSQDEARVTAMLDALEKGIKQAEARNLPAFQGTAEVFAEANERAVKYGLTFCYSA